MMKRCVHRMFSASSEKENRRDIMAVDSTDLQDLLKNVDLKSILGSSTMADTTGGLGIGGGVLGAVLVGALLPRLLGDQNGLNSGAAATLANQTAEKAAIDSAVASALASANQQNNNSMLLLKDIQDSTAEVISNSNSNAQTALVQQLQGQISNMQGQASILAGVESAKGVVVNEVHESGAESLAAIGNSSAGILSNLNVLNTNVLQGFSSTNTNITNDGDKTRAAIAALGASIPNARELDLQRQLAVALDNERHERLSSVVRSGNVDVTTNVNQATSQSQTQAQIQGITTTLATLVPYIQNIGQSVVNLGTMVASPTAATNVRA